MSVSQCDLVLDYLIKNHTITPMEAMEEFGIMRLGARIYDLKHRGYDITSETTVGKNRYGKTIKYATYTYHYQPGEPEEEIRL